jgi:hypothetical protein
MEIVKRISAPMADGRIANGYEVTSPGTWSEAMALKGQIVDGAEVLEVAAPRMDPLPVGTRINLVTRG